MATTNQTAKPLIRAFALVMLVALSLVGRAASAGIDPVVNLKLADGLAGETVHRVMTDHIGHVWIATTGGVSVFNGKRLVSMPITDERGRMVTVNDLCETASHTVYAATEQGLYRLPLGQAQFEHVLPEVLAPNNLLAVGDTLYIGGQQGFQLYDGHSLKWVNIGASRKGLDNIVRQYIKGDDGLIWFLGRYELNSYDPKTEQIKSCPLDKALREKVILTQFAILGDGHYLIGTRGNGLYCYDLRRDSAEHVNGVGNIISTVEMSADGHVCVGTDGAGAFLLDRRTLEVVERFGTEADGRHRLPSNGVYCYHRDANGVDWFGFVRYGLAYVCHNSGLFRPFQVGGFTTLGLNVRSFCRHGDDILIGTQSGFHYVDARTQASRYFSAEDLGGGHIVNVLTFHDGLFYIGTFDGGMRVFDPRTQTLSRQQFSPLLDRESIGDIKVSPEGELWIGCSQGLFIIGRNGTVQNFNDRNSHIVSGLVLSITFDRTGNAWLTGATGCSLYSVHSREIVDTSFPKGFFDHEPWMRGSLGHDGLIFMRTGPQTFYTNEQMTDYGELHFPLAFHDKWCRSFIDDMKGHYWLASERGLFRFDYQWQSMIHTSYGEGVQGDFINDMSLDGDGTLWVATSQGLFSVKADDLEAWQQSNHYRVQLNAIRKGSDLIAPNEEYRVNEGHTIRLSWNLGSEVLQVEPVLLDYALQTGRLYEYRVDGGNWQIVNDGEPIALRGLWPGRYRLEVRLAGAEGTASVYTVAVVPSLWVMLEVLTLLALLASLFFWNRYRKRSQSLLSERNDMEEALMEAEQELEEAAAEEAAEAVQKYQKVRIDEAECADIVQRMQQYIEHGKVYTDVNLKMKDLADALHLSAPKLSQVFNLYLNTNYYDFINRYRLDEFKRLIEAGEHKRVTITALSEQCGFKKSSFFSTFRKVEGMTPNEYLKKHGVNV